MSLSLAEVQALVLKGVIDGDDQALTLVRPPPKDTPQTMFGVYRNAYVLRLVEFIGNDYERLKLFMRDDFDRMARHYIKAHPSDTPNARWFARHLSDFLRSNKPWSEKPELGDLAALEKALNDAFDAPDDPLYTLADLAAFDPSTIADAKVTLHASAIRLTSGINSTDLWSSPDAEVNRLEEPLELLVWRQGGSARFRVLTAEEAMAFDSAKTSVPFGVLCEMIAVMGDPDNAAMRAAGYLRSWIETEIVSDFAV
jgi:hypothetical protein